MSFLFAVLAFAAIGGAIGAALRRPLAGVLVGALLVPLVMFLLILLNQLWQGPANGSRDIAPSLPTVTARPDYFSPTPTTEPPP